MVFTADAVRSLALPDGKREERWFDASDRAPSNFGVKLVQGARGVQRTWIVQHRHNGEQRTPSFGKVSDVSLAEAQLAARQHYAKLLLDQDPQAVKRAAKEARKAAADEKARDTLTFGALKGGFIEHLERNGRSPKHVADTRRYLDRAWQPLHELRVDRIERKLIAARLTQIAREVGATSGNRARMALSAFFAWAIGEGIADANPVAGTNKPLEAEPSRDRVLTDDELVWIWRACEDDDYGGAVRLMMLLGQRRGEIEGLLRTEIDRKRRLWTMAGDRTKNGRPHEVPLSDQALKILDGLLSREGRDDRDLVLGEREGGFSGWSKSKRALDARIADARKAAGVKPAELPDWRHHDLRRTAATGMANLGIQPHVVEVVLNHVSGFRSGVAGVYNRALYRAEKAQALDRWAEHVVTLVEGKPSNVVALRPGASA